ncbi:restriction endonuclease subunit S [Lactobacillus delbrueckii subsp. bulgaricus]
MFAWEQRKLGDVCEPITDSIDTQKYPNEVFSEYSMPAFDASMKPDIVLGSSMNSVRKIITRPCLLVNKLNVRKKRIWYVKKPNKNAVCSAEFIPLHSDTVDLTFLNQVAKSETFTRYLENHSSGSSNSQKRITPRSLMLSKLHIPTIEEQKLIGKIFEYLDHTITLHEEKKRQLERLKSALLQKMFADKSGYPPVRFEGFSDKWEQVKYGEIFQRRSKMGVSTPTLPSVEYDDINPGMGTLNKEPKSKGISKRGIYFNPGDVLFGKLRPYLKNWLFACFEGVAVGDFWVLTSSKIDHGFTYSLIQTPGFQYIANLSSGSKMPRSDWGLVSNARTFIPINHLEQERISSVLFGLDHAITLYEHKLEILNKIKSFLLQNMFI